MLSDERRREAEAAIARLIHTYCHRLDAGDFGGAAALFDEARWQLSEDVVCVGADEHRTALERGIRLYGDRPGTRHAVSNIIVDVDDDGHTAQSLSYVLTSQVTPTFPLQLIFQGRYEDSFVCEDGLWRFTARTVLADGAGDMSAHQVPST